MDFANRSGLEMLNNALLNFGNTQRQQQQLNVGNARANQELALQQLAGARQQKQMEFGMSQALSDRAKQDFATAVQARASLNGFNISPQTVTYLLESGGNTQGLPPGMAQQAAGILDAARSAYATLPKGERAKLPSSYTYYYGQGATPSNAGGPQKQPGYAPEDLKDLEKANLYNSALSQEIGSAQAQNRQTGGGTGVYQPSVPGLQPYTTRTPLPTPTPPINPAAPVGTGALVEMRRNQIKDIVRKSFDQNNIPYTDGDLASAADSILNPAVPQVTPRPR
jgi:hypothetical protein